MVSKNNRINKMTKAAERKPHFAIRKLTIGAASILLGTTLWMSTTASTSHAETVNDGADESHQESGTQASNVTSSAKNVVVTTNNNNENPATNQDQNVADATKETPVAEKSAAEKASEVLTQDAKANTAKVKVTEASNDVGKIETVGQQGKKDAAVNSPSQDHASEASTKKQTKSTTETPAKKVNIKITGVDDYDGSSFYGNVDDTIQAGITSNDHVYYNHVGYKLMNPEALDGLDLTNVGIGNGTLIVPDHDVDITLHFAKLAPISVEYVDTDGNVLTKLAVSSEASTSESQYADKDGIHTSVFSVNAIDIPGYELVSDPSLRTKFDQVITKENPQPKQLKFVYKKVAAHAEDGLPDSGSGITGTGTDYGISWASLPGGVTLDNTRDNYGENHYEETINRMKEVYTKQGFSFLGVTNDHKDTDPTNRLESYISVHFLPHKAVTVNYVDQNGKKLAATDVLNFNKDNPDQTNNGINPSQNWYANGEWKSEPKTFAGYSLKKVKGATEGKFTTFSYNVTYVYALKQAENANLHLVDISDNNKEIDNFNASGKDTDAISFNGAQTTIEALVKAGYKVNGIVQATSDPNAPIKYGTDYASAASKWTFDDQPGVDQSFYVYLEHDYTPINPTNSYGRNDLTHEVTETVHYVDEATGKPVATDYTNKVTFNAQGRVDKVTGKMLAIKSIENGQITYDYNVANEIDIATAKASDFAWSNPVTFAKAASPVIDGYTIDKITPSELAEGNDIKEIANVGYDHSNVEATVYYKANPAEVHKAELTIYANDKQVGSASAKGAKDTAINFGEIGQTVEAYINNGWKFDHAQDITNNTVMSGKSYSELNFGKYSTKNNSEQKFAIYLTKAAEPTQQTAQLIINDATPGQAMQLGSYTQPGLEGHAISFDGASAQISDLLAKGYIWDGAIYNDNQLDAKSYAGIDFGNYDKTDDQNTISQKWVINLVHGYTPVNPDHPHDGVNPSEYTKEVKETVHYTGAGDKTPADSVQTSKWNRTLTVDTVTNKVVDNGQYTTDWSIAKGEKTTYAQVNTPVVDGYHADKRDVPATAVTQDNIEVTVNYAQNGKIVPVDPSGKPIPGAPTPTYPTDPSDPTKVTPNEPVPTVPAKTPSQTTITPTDPGKDTPVVYNNGGTPAQPDTPAPNPQPEVIPTPKPTPVEPNTPAPQPEVTPTPTEPEAPAPKPEANPTPDEPEVVAPKANKSPEPEKTVSAKQKSVKPHAAIVTAGGQKAANASYVIKHESKKPEAQTLPQTGDNQSQTELAAIAGGIVAGLGLIGLTGVKKRRN